MGECVFEANGLDHDRDFPYANHDDAPRETSTETNQPQRSTRASLAEAMCKWIGANPLDYNNSFLTANTFFPTESVILPCVPLGTLKIVLWFERVTRLGWEVRPAEHLHS